MEILSTTAVAQGFALWSLHELVPGTIPCRTVIYEKNFSVPYGPECSEKYPRVNFDVLVLIVQKFP